MKLLGVFLATFSLLQVACPAFARTDSILQMAPSSRWAIDYAQDSCALRRSFTNGADQATLELRSFVIGDAFEVTISGAAISRTRGQVRTQFAPDSAFSEPRDVAFLDSPGMKAVRYTDTMRPAELKNQTGSLSEWPDAERDARERAVTELKIEGAFRQVLVFKTGPMASSMNALRICVDDLLKQSGIDPVVQRSLSRKIKPIEQMTWARRTREGLPTTILRAGGTGYALLRLIVGPDGKPTACTPLRLSGAEEFAKYACDTALQYARFEPAIDAQGEPVASAFMTKVTYSI